jgi:hypothetical protein
MSKTSEEIKGIGVEYETNKSEWRDVPCVNSDLLQH